MTRAAMHFYAITHSRWHGWHLRRNPPLRRNWRKVAVFAAECAAVCAVLISLLALGAALDA